MLKAKQETSSTGLSYIFSIYLSLMFKSCHNYKRLNVNLRYKEIENLLKLITVDPLSFAIFSQFEREATSTGADVETGGNSSNKKKGKWRVSALKMFSRIFVQAFTLTFLAEWGDRSQLTTIILAASEVYNFSPLQNNNNNCALSYCVFVGLQDVVGVTVGGTLGHCLCTGLAVLGGRMIAQRISVRTGECHILFYHFLPITVAYFVIKYNFLSVLFSYNHRRCGVPHLCSFCPVF